MKLSIQLSIILFLATIFHASVIAQCSENWAVNGSDLSDTRTIKKIQDLNSGCMMEYAPAFILSSSLADAFGKRINEGNKNDKLDKRIIKTLLLYLKTYSNTKDIPQAHMHLCIAHSYLMNVIQEEKDNGNYIKKANKHISHYSSIINKLNKNDDVKAAWYTSLKETSRSLIVLENNRISELNKNLSSNAEGTVEYKFSNKDGDAYWYHLYKNENFVRKVHVTADYDSGGYYYISNVIWQNKDDKIQGSYTPSTGSLWVMFPRNFTTSCGSIKEAIDIMFKEKTK